MSAGQVAVWEWHTRTWALPSEEGKVKYVIEYEARATGLTYEQALTNQDALLRAFSKWTPEQGLTIHAFLSTMGARGYVFVEADDPGPVDSFLSKFLPWVDINVVPVRDVAEAVTTATESAAWVREALSG
jgi:hypothetical protein